MAGVRHFQVTFDCAIPERVGRFWCEAMGYVVPPPPPGFADWGEFDDALPAAKQGSAFACVDPGLDGSERLAGLEAECARLVELGATRLRLLPAGDGEESCIVMRDVEGNEFCLD